MSSSFAGLFNEFFDSKMEGFETAFPGKIEKVNDDGTVDIVPSIKNCLKNMQMEPLNKDGLLNCVYGVPVLFCGTSGVIVEFELKKGDPVLCVSSSRDLREWISGGWNGGPYNPKSFSGNDLNDLLAIPMRRKNHGNQTTRVYIDSSGGVLIDTSKKVKIESDYVGISGNLVVEGTIKAKGDVIAKGDSLDISLSSHFHNSAVGPCTPPPNGVPVPIPEPT